MILGENDEKMSKSRGNVINPDAIVKEYGADSLRLYEMFMGPLEAAKPWSMQGVNGVHGFLEPRLAADHRRPRRSAAAQRRGASIARRRPSENRVLHQTIEAVTDDIDKL